MDHTYIVEQRAVFARGLKVPFQYDLIVGHGAQVRGSIYGARNLHLASGSWVRGNVESGVDVVIGAGARVDGSVRAGGQLWILEGARVGGDAVAGGRIRIYGAHVQGLVRALGDLEVGGETTLNEVAAGGRISTMPAPRRMA